MKIRISIQKKILGLYFVNKVLILFVNHKNDTIHPVSHAGFDEALVTDLEFKIGQDFYGTVAASQSSELVEDQHNDPRFSPKSRFDPRVKSVIAVPFGRRGKYR